MSIDEAVSNFVQSVYDEGIVPASEQVDLVGTENMFYFDIALRLLQYREIGEILYRNDLPDGNVVFFELWDIFKHEPGYMFIQLENTQQATEYMHLHQYMVESRIDADSVHLKAIEENSKTFTDRYHSSILFGDDAIRAALQLEPPSKLYRE